MTQQQHHSGEEGSNGGQPPEPEVIILDSDGTGHGSSHRREFADIADVTEMRFSFWLRLLFLILALLCVPWLAGSIICWSFLALFHLVTFYRFESIEPLILRFWGGIVRSIAFGVGFLIAAVSPPLGLGFIMMYVSLYEDSNGMMGQHLRNNFSKFSK